jgi:hypothetical protein
MGPAEAERLLGPPSSAEDVDGGGRRLTWRRKHHLVELGFGPPAEPPPPGLAEPGQMLEVVSFEVLK